MVPTELSKEILASARDWKLLMLVSRAASLAVVGRIASLPFLEESFGMRGLSR